MNWRRVKSKIIRRLGGIPSWEIPVNIRVDILKWETAKTRDKESFDMLGSGFTSEISWEQSKKKS